jgi:hypothetical protein
MLRHTKRSARSNVADPDLTGEEFALRMRRAGLELGPADMAMLFEEIAPSCRIVATMAEHIRSRLAAADEPAHIFRRTDDDDRM